VSSEILRHKPIHEKDEIERTDWLPDGPLKIGITAGASTPDVKVDESIERVLAFRGLAKADLTT
jgi:4-hydroxy-3-methylbut-2-enyl diphosphate reductase